MPTRWQAIIWVNTDPTPWRIYASLGGGELTHWGRDKMVNIFQTTFPNAFSWMKMFDFCTQFHLSFFLRVQLTIRQHWFRYNGLALNRRQAIIWTNDGLIWWHTHAPLGLNELTKLHFHMFFLEWQVLYFGPNFIEVCSWSSNWQQFNIVSCPNKIPAIHQTTFSLYFLDWRVLHFGPISLKFIPEAPTDMIQNWFEVMVWCWTDNKLPYTLLSQV